MVDNSHKILANDVIVACATPMGFSALAVLRGSGNGVIELFQSALNLYPNIVTLSANRACLINFSVGDFCERAIITIFRKPKTYTGEDMVELSVYGNPLLVKMILDKIINSGARLAEPGEFTLRAVMNGKMDFIEAESIYNIVNSQTRHALLASRRAVLDSEKIKSIQKEVHAVLIDTVALLEFPEDDIGADDFGLLRKRIESSLCLLKDFLNRAKMSRVFQNGLTVVISGEVNSGKSTLFNQIVGKEKAIVSPHPGTTRDIVEATCEINGFPVTILDTAGIREPTHPVEEEGIRRARSAFESADMTIWLIDGAESDCSVKPFDGSIVVANKCDLPLSDQVLKSFPDSPRISALTGEGIDKLLMIIEQRLSAIPSDALNVSERVEKNLTQARDELSNAIDAAGKGFWDIFQISLEKADALLSEIFMAPDREDIYDEIFPKFCVGK